MVSLDLSPRNKAFVFSAVAALILTFLLIYLVSPHYQSLTGYLHDTEEPVYDYKVLHSMAITDFLLFSLSVILFCSLLSTLLFLGMRGRMSIMDGFVTGSLPGALIIPASLSLWLIVGMTKSISASYFMSIYSMLIFSFLVFLPGSIVGMAVGSFARFIGRNPGKQECDLREGLGYAFYSGALYNLPLLIFSSISLVTSISLLLGSAKIYNTWILLIPLPVSLICVVLWVGVVWLILKVHVKKEVLDRRSRNIRNLLSVLLLLFDSLIYFGVSTYFILLMMMLGGAP